MQTFHPTLEASPTLPMSHGKILALLAILLVPAVTWGQDTASVIDKAPAPFGQTCAVCHGGDAEGTDRAPALLGNRQLRGKSDADIAAIIKGGRGNMPSFSFLPDEQVQTLAHFIHALNADAYDVQPAGDTRAGARIFFEEGRCAECHTAQGRGGTQGPDLSNIGRAVTLSELDQAIDHPATRIAAGYDLVEVTRRDGSSLRGFARSRPPAFRRTAR